ncbi:nuclear condensin complex subunit [Stylonychia lemnae]|uniref:Nuclear condensin complex subunit n=1 Tax=Stylonychia lemnae TaxID=5949 RepID=A0A078AP69_STYLE|nr:nuclear condensin complex subunit [Stylonychia lemnae]|eukprot:CDW83919.1 nuclear condensin complex subunit [Stylonychia lemnae]
MPPKAQKQDEVGLLEYLEDIIGTIKYNQDIADLEKLQEDGQERKQSKMLDLYSTNDALGKIEKDKDDAINFLNMERGLYLLKNILFQIEIREKTKEMQKSGEQIEKFKIKAQQLKDELRQVKQNNQDAVMQIQLLNDEEEKRKAVNEDLVKQFKQLTIYDEKVRFDMKQLALKMERTRENIRQIEQNKINKIQEFSEIEVKIPRLKNELKNLNGIQETMELELNVLEVQLKEKTMRLRKDRENILKSLRPLQQQRQEKQTTLRDKQTDIQIIQNNHSNLESDYQRVTQAIQRDNENIVMYTNKLNEEISKKQQIAQKLEITENQLKLPQFDSYSLERDVQRKKQKLEMIRDYINNHRNKNKLLFELLEAQNKGQINGILGRLGDLGSIDQKYDIAISSGCGFLDHIVVKTLDDANQCINYLRQNRLGIAKFMVLEKIQDKTQHSEAVNFKCPPKSERLYDLIKIENQDVRRAFYLALKNTLVCQNIEDAQTIAYQRNEKHRVVTLQGYLIELSGTMSGGGRPRQGGMSSDVAQRGLYTEENAVQLQNEIEIQEKQIYEAQQLRPQLKDQYNNLQRELRQSELQIQSNNINLDQLNQHKQDQERRLQQITSQRDIVMKDILKIQGIQNQIQKINEDLAREQPQIEQLQNQLNQIDDKIQESMSAQHNKVRNEKNQIESQILMLEKEIQSLKLKIESSNQILKNIDKQKLDEDKVQKGYEKKMQELRGELDELTRQGEKILKLQKDNNETKERENQKKNEMKELYLKLKPLLDDVMQKYNDVKQLINEEGQKALMLKQKNDKLIEKLFLNREKCQKFVQQFKEVFREVDLVRQQRLNLKVESPIHDQNQRDKNEVSAFMDVEEIQQANTRRIIDYASMSKEQRLEHFTDQYDIVYQFNSEILEILCGDLGFIREAINQLEEQVKGLNINFEVINTYKMLSLQKQQKEEELKNMTMSYQEIRDRLHQVRKQRENDFLQGFNIIAKELKQIYRFITNGGDAELDLVDSLDPFSEGIQFNVRPLKKSWKEMKKLSGGEKTISSLALIFALHIYKPSPLYFMDEIDAALDYKNVAIVGQYIKQRAIDSQFLIISLRNNMFELAEKLYGIYKINDTTKFISMIPEDVNTIIEEKRKQLQQQKQQQSLNSNQEIEVDEISSLL